jgi:hypothetical protein
MIRSHTAPKIGERKGAESKKRKKERKIKDKRNLMELND